jgi:hypothetical protein
MKFEISIANKAEVNKILQQLSNNRKIRIDKAKAMKLAIHIHRFKNIV